MLRGAGKVMEMSNTHTTVGSGGDWAEQTGEHVCCLKGRGDQLLPRGNLGPAGAQCSDDSTEVGNLNFEAKFPELLNFGLKKFFFFFVQCKPYLLAQSSCRDTIRILPSVPTNQPKALSLHL